ncbi:MAG: ATP-binding cassette domain-containing protein, partial [Chloroflexia bacterium]
MADSKLSGLQLNNVTKAFRKLVAVDDLTLHVPRGSMFGLLGANGAGKTTTLRMVLSILRPDTGTITWDGEPISSIARSRFGYLPEERGLYPKMKAGEQLVFLAGLNDIGSTEANRRAREWLGRVGLGGEWGRKVEELSKGNQQKVQVLAALIHDPDLMLLDEPFSGLDPINTEILRETLLQRRDQGRTIIFSSHRLEQVEELCDHVAIIHRGRLLTSGPLSTLKKQSGRALVELGFKLPVDSAPALDTFINGLGHDTHVVRERRTDSIRIELRDGLTPENVLQAALASGPGEIKRF